MSNDREGKVLVWYTILAVLVGAGILVMSLSKMSFVAMVNSEKEGNMPKEPINFEWIDETGQIQRLNYALPLPGIDSSHPVYGLKEFRNWLWINLPGKPEEKTNLLILMADKKMAETKKLVEDNRVLRALETSGEAVENLKQARLELEGAVISSEQKLGLRKRIVEAGLAYEKIIESMSDSFNLDTVKHNRLMLEIKGFNEKEKRDWLEIWN